MRTPIIAGNWKMHLLADEALAMVTALRALVADATGVEIVVCPPFTALHSVAKAVSGSGIALGAQNCYPRESGAFTGEVSPRMIRDMGCDWVIIGHSERRQHFGESDAFLNEKLKFALSAGLRVIFCVGETLEERDGGEMDEVLRRQVGQGLEGLRDDEFDALVLAYEPVWAIGTGRTATPEQADEAHGFVRALVRERFDETLADQLRIQYGGSVKPENAGELLACPHVDGALVGGASLDAESFAAIVKAGAAAA